MDKIQEFIENYHNNIMVSLDTNINKHFFNVNQNMAL